MQSAADAPTEAAAAWLSDAKLPGLTRRRSRRGDRLGRVAPRNVQTGVPKKVREGTVLVFGRMGDVGASEVVVETLEGELREDASPGTALAVTRKLQ